MISNKRADTILKVTQQIGFIAALFLFARAHALFLGVMTERADQRCSMFVPWQCGHVTSPSS
jgi:hypothetical protein